MMHCRSNRAVKLTVRTRSCTKRFWKDHSYDRRDIFYELAARGRQIILVVSNLLLNEFSFSLCISLGGGSIVQPKILLGQEAKPESGELTPSLYPHSRAIGSEDQMINIMYFDDYFMGLTLFKASIPYSDRMDTFLQHDVGEKVGEE